MQKQTIGWGRVHPRATPYGKKAENKNTCVKESVKARGVQTCTEQIDEQTREAEMLL